MSLDDATLSFHQVIHGYQRGHRLLGSSVPLDDHTAELLSHNSDSAPRARTGDEAYLTGYPIDKHTYVLARTWNELNAERPNTVITLSVIIPHALKLAGTVAQLYTFLADMEPPESRLHNELPEVRLRIPAAGGLRLTVQEAEIASAYYFGIDPLTEPAAESRDRIAIALWSQLWSSARYNFYFCTAPDTSRFRNQRRPLLFSSPLMSNLPSAGRFSDSRARLASDLVRPSQFRSFLHFAASGESVVELGAAIAEAYELLESEQKSPSAFIDLLGRYNALRPQRLRRLKRRMLAFQGLLPLWSVDPYSLLSAIASGPLGQIVAYSDSSLSDWVSLCWRGSPRLTASILTSTPAPSPAQTEKSRTAREGLEQAFSDAIITSLTSESLSTGFEVSQASTFHALVVRNEAELWKAWSGLHNRIPAQYVPPYDYDWSGAVTALRETPAALTELVNWQRRALDALIEECDRRPADQDLHLQLSAGARRYVNERLRRSTSLLTGLSRLSDPDDLSVDATAIDAQLPAWLNLVRVSNDDAVLATAYLVARHGGPRLASLSALATGRLFSVLKDSAGEDGWRRIRNRISGDPNSWDHCAQLIGDYSLLIGAFDERTKLRSVELLRDINEEAAQSVGQQLERRRESQKDSKKKKKFNLFDPWTW